MSTPSRFFITGAAGQLGQLVVAELARLAGPEQVTAIVRDPVRAANLFPAGVTLRTGDYDQPETLATALHGAERLLLISSNAIGNRVEQHRHVIEAATQAKVSRLAYTSVLHADTSPMRLAEDHRQTEALIAASGVPYTLLRNGWYHENYTASIPAALHHGALIGSAGQGRISSAARADYAAAAAIALMDDGAGDRVVHELAGDTAYTLPEFAAELSRQTGRQVPYVNLPEADYCSALVGAGLPPQLAAFIADSDVAAAQDALFDTGQALSRLLGRPTKPFAQTMAQALSL
ncbi:NAD(P)-dependent oxidoreductase [Niveispirillum lacus]|uniref:NAD(P)-dependent oxidoreductase n=1 Tax=Niveispirillum lacus TaxID=1981099 RepID=A0A255YZN7_9PROT|nr:SDR family oxidoreductase [Niveispirillum lacus]OYQ34641.1 NAD(P)-dependent oxidoreductase [Niveispirillum lacus]